MEESPDEEEKRIEGLLKNWKEEAHTLKESQALEKRLLLLLQKIMQEGEENTKGEDFLASIATQTFFKRLEAYLDGRKKMRPKELLKKIKEATRSAQTKLRRERLNEYVVRDTVKRLAQRANKIVKETKFVPIPKAQFYTLFCYGTNPYPSRYNNNFCAIVNYPTKNDGEIKNVMVTTAVEKPSALEETLYRYVASIAAMYEERYYGGKVTKLCVNYRGDIRQYKFTSKEREFAETFLHNSSQQAHTTNSLNNKNKAEPEFVKDVRGRSRIQIDMGKLFRLRWQGRSIKNIAKELGVSCLTVSKRLKELKELEVYLNREGVKEKEREKEQVKEKIVKPKQESEISINTSQYCSSNIEANKANLEVKDTEEIKPSLTPEQFAKEYMIYTLYGNGEVKGRGFISSPDLSPLYRIFGPHKGVIEFLRREGPSVKATYHEVVGNNKSYPYLVSNNLLSELKEFQPQSRDELKDILRKLNYSGWIRDVEAESLLKLFSSFSIVPEGMRIFVEDNENEK